MSGCRLQRQRPVLLVPRQHHGLQCAPGVCSGKERGKEGRKEGGTEGRREGGKERRERGRSVLLVQCAAGLCEWKERGKEGGREEGRVGEGGDREGEREGGREEGIGGLEKKEEERAEGKDAERGSVLLVPRRQHGLQCSTGVCSGKERGKEGGREGERERERGRGRSVLLVPQQPHAHNVPISWGIITTQKSWRMPNHPIL